VPPCELGDEPRTRSNAYIDPNIVSFLVRRSHPNVPLRRGEYNGLSPETGLLAGSVLDDFDAGHKD
jgi:hypothetical protein